MRFTKGLALTMLGAGAVLAYQKYSKPIMNRASRVANDALKTTENKLDDMM